MRKTFYLTSISLCTLTLLLSPMTLNVPDLSIDPVTAWAANSGQGGGQGAVHQGAVD